MYMARGGLHPQLLMSGMFATSAFEGIVFATVAGLAASVLLADHPVADVYAVRW
jgi:hypothetical protein